jgi:hypothetical protein
MIGLRRHTTETIVEERSARARAAATSADLAV